MEILLRGGCWLVAVAAPLAALLLSLPALTQANARLDLRVYRDAIALWLSGQPLYEVRVTEMSLPFTYPPPAALALAPLHFPATTVAIAVWSAISAGCVYLVTRWAYRSIPGRPVPPLVIAATAGALLLASPVWQTMDLGQVNLVLLALVCADFLRPAPARARGILTGIATAIKVTPLVLFAYPLLHRDWRAIAQGAATLLVIATAGLVFLRQETLDYLAIVWDPSRIGGPSYAANQSLAGLLHRADIYTTPLWVGLAAAVAALGGYVAWHYRHQSRVVPLLCIAVAGLLASPISWDHHWVWVCLGPAAALSLWRTEPRRFPSVATACFTATLALLVPVNLRFIADQATATTPSGWALMSSSYVLAALAWLTCLAASGSSQHSREARTPDGHQTPPPNYLPDHTTTSASTHAPLRAELTTSTPPGDPTRTH